MSPEMQSLLQRAEDNSARLKACPLHDFENASADERVKTDFVCRHCGGVVNFHAQHWYQLGRMHQRQATATRPQTATHWNAIVPVGTPVRYFPVLGESRNIETRTRSEAWTLGHGAAVVLIEGRTGGVLLEALEILKEAR